MAIHHGSTMGSPEQFTPEQIFNDYLPKVIGAQKDLARRINAVYVFRLSGNKGGDWTIDLPNLKVKKGTPKQADLVVDMTADDFSKMVNGRWDAAEAVRAKRVDYHGRLDLLTNLAGLLRPAM